jgi:hypothetical protein
MLEPLVSASAVSRLPLTERPFAVLLTLPPFAVGLASFAPALLSAAALRTGFFFFDGPLAARAAMSSTASATLRLAGSLPLGIVALTAPCFT